MPQTHPSRQRPNEADGARGHTGIVIRKFEAWRRPRSRLEPPTRTSSITRLSKQRVRSARGLGTIRINELAL